MKVNIKSCLEQVDYIFSQIYLRLFEERNSLITFLFHGLFHDEKEVHKNFVYPPPHEGITVEHFRRFIEFYLEHNYIFVSPEDILNGLDKDKRYILITFDDGYFSNGNTLPILKEYKVPAVFFISTNHVKYNKCFWYDALYRERRNQGKSIKQISREIQLFKRKRTEGIENFLKDNFGKKSLCPKSDIDRPFTPSELRDFSREKYVFLGNHTKNHAILTNYSEDEIKEQIFGAQKSIYEITGIKPKIIAYPNGYYSNKIIKISREVGLKLGLSVIQKKNYLPINLQGNESMRLGRFVLHGDRDLEKQCQLFRADISLKTLYNRLKTLLNIK